MSSFDTPSAVVGLELDGRGFDEINSKLDKHGQGWERVEQSVGRVGNKLGGLVSKIGMVAAGFGAAQVIGDFLKLEDVASRAAIAVGKVGGASTYGAYRDSLRDAGLATSIDGVALGMSAQGIVDRLGAAGMSAPSAWGGLGTGLGHFSRATGIDVGQLGASGGEMAFFQRMRASSVPGLLQGVYSQAARTGNTAQVAQWLQAISGSTAMFGGMHPGTDASGLSQRMGAMYGAVSGQNSVFRDPGLFQQGAMGFDSVSTSAYSNPRLQAAYQMAGVGYWQQRGGLAGKGGVDMAKKMLSWSERTYGKGTIEQDLFLRSNFGDVSADMLKSFADGQVTYDDLMKKGGDVDGEIQEKSRANQDTPNARLNRVQQGATDSVDGILADLLDTLGIDSFEEAVTLLGAGVLGKRLLGKGGRALFNKLKRKAGSKTAQAAAEAAAARAAAGGGAGATASKFGLGRLGRFALKGGVVTTAAGILLDPGDLADEDAITLKNRTQLLREKFGEDWASNPAAKKYAIKRFNLHGKQGRLTETMGEMFRQGGATQTIDSLDQAADKLNKAADKMLKKFEVDPSTGRAKEASYMDPAGLGGHPSSQMGSSMMLARYLGAGGGGTTGGSTLAKTQMVAMGLGGGGGGAGGGGGGGAGSGWKTCTLTWYDPALGGTNSGSGLADPDSPMANGDPYSPTGMTCAAPKAYAFGTKIEFKLGNKTVTCTVTDRGGAITGSHFDLSRGAAAKIGLINAGRATGKFRTVGGGRAAAGGSGGGSTATLASAGGGADAAWVSGAGAAAASTGAALGGGGRGGSTVVNIDGREIARQKRLVRG